MTRCMYRYEIPIDDQKYSHKLTDPIRRVGYRESILPSKRYGDVPIMEFWAEHDDEHESHADTRTFQVFGTGQPLPDNAVWVGTSSRDQLGLVFHLYELT
jgi:hypothetical protein